jgi:hypothetical protein
MLESLHVTIGIRRSGNHAITGWIASQLAGLDVKSDGVALARDVMLVADGVSYANNVAPEILGDLAQRDPIPGEKHRILCVEVCGFDVESELSGGHAAKNGFLSVVLRNPINHLASILEGSSRFEHVLKNYVLNWKTCLGFCEGLEVDGYKRTGILFDRWFSDRSYRDELARKMGFANRDLGLDLVSGNGGGSSFDMTGKDGEARSMDVLGRWRGYAADERLLSEVSQLRVEAERVFGAFPEEITQHLEEQTG